jgi:hypothetical protein
MVSFVVSEGTQGMMKQQRQRLHRVTRLRVHVFDLDLSAGYNTLE